MKLWFTASIFSSLLAISSLCNGENTHSHTSIDACLVKNGVRNFTLFPGNREEKNSTAFYSLLDFSIQNLRFALPSVPKPAAIVLPASRDELARTVKCCRKESLEMRVRSGGHSYEGTSSVAIDGLQFVIIDLMNLENISIDLASQTAWIEGGVTLGQLYYAIAEKSPVHGFPAGLYATVGVGGHFGGGGVGNLIRKYGLAADNVIDAKIINANGNLLDRRSMGSGVFWAIRGGGGASFGVIVAWKIRLARVSPVVTVFEVPRSLEQGAISLLHKWQDIAHKAPKDLLISVVLDAGGGTPTRGTFRSVFLGEHDDLLRIMNKIFPELNVTKQDCEEMSWIESIVRFSSYQRGVTIEALKNNVPPLPDSYNKGKIDLVYKPIPSEALGELWNRCSSANTPPIIHFELHPYGGRMDEISESDTPFPHRKGVLYEILYIIGWFDGSEEIGESHIDWLRGLSEFMTPFVSKDPRRTILNARDFDLGINDVVPSASTSYSKGKMWGSRYFNHNFKRLALVKGEADPHNFFYFEQSIPPLTHHTRLDD